MNDTDVAEALSSLDIDAAIAAHLLWAKRLQALIDGQRDDLLTVEVAANHSLCQLGQWLYGKGAIYDFFTQYHELVMVHKMFHEAAGEIVSAHLTGNDQYAAGFLAGEFQRLSQQVVDLLNSLRLD